MSNILVTGANGQLGQEIQSLSQIDTKNKFFFTDISELDITKIDAIEQFVIENKIEEILNCAAYTAVDKAEDEFELADLVNHIAVKNLAEIAKKYDLKFVHTSTDYVFSGENFIPYLPTDIPNPKSVYGKTKLEGEQALQKINPANSIIIRTAWVYSEFGNNFVKTMLRLGVERDNLNIIYDQIGSPTYAKDLAKAILTALPQIENTTVGVFHFTNEGICSWYDFATSIFEIKNIDCKVNAIPTEAYPTKATRPRYSVLNKQSLKEKYNIEIPYWRNSLQECLQKL